MTLVETIARAAAAVFLAGGQLAVAHHLAARLVDPEAFVARWAATFVTGMSVATIGFHALAAAQLFTLPAALLAMAGLLALVFGPRPARALWREDLRRERASLRRVARLVRRSPRRIWIGAFAAATVTVALRPWVIPPLGWDTLVYHATKAGLWVHEGGLRFLRGISSWATFSNLPAGGEVFTAWAMLPFHAETLAMGAEAVQFVGVLVAMVALAREIGLREPFATTAAFVFATLPPMRLLVGSGYIEPGMCLAFIGGAVFAVRYLRRGGAGHLALAAAGVGLSIGFKVTMAPMALLLLAACGIRALARRQLRDVLAAALLFVVLASPWYVYNIIDSGRPLTPFSTVIAGFDLGNPTPGVRKAFEDLARAFPPYVWPREWEAFQRTFLFTARQPETLGYASAVPFVVFLGTWPFWVRRRWTVAVPLVLVVAANLAYLYGREAAPLRMLWPESVSRFWLPAFAIAIPASALWCRRFPRAGRAWLAVLLLIGFYNALRYLHLHHAPYDIDAQLRLGLALLGAGILLRLVPRRRRLAAGAAAAVVLLAGLDRHVIAHRWEAFGRSMVIHYTPTVWVPLGRAVDHPGTPHRIAVTGGGMSGSESWFGYGLLGSRLQNDLFYVPITRDGGIVDEFPRLKEVGDAAAWIRRIGERGVDFVVSMQPATIEITWMVTNPHLFEPVVAERPGRDPGRGVWRVRRDRFASAR